MTEDDVRFRFEIVKGKEWIKDYGSDSASKYDIYEGLYSVTKLLNKLHMENMGLKSSNLEYEDALGRLEEENEQLKSEITTLKGGYDEYEEIIGELKAENEKLKEENKSWLKTAYRMDTIHHEDREYCERLHKENEQLKHNNKMLSMKMSEVSTKYRLLKEFSDDTNPNEAVETVLHELMMITKEYR